MAFFPAAPAMANITDVTVAETVVLNVSHLVLLAAVPLLLLYGIDYLAVATIPLLFNSLLYHLARGLHDGMAFGIDVDTARRLDHVSATAAPGAVALTALLLDRGGGASGQLARTLLPFVVLFAVMAFPFQVQSLVLVLVFVLAVAGDRLLRQSDFQMPSAPPGGYTDWRWFAGMLAATVAGVVCFYLPDADYAFAHTLWHLFIGAALIFAAFAFTRNRRRRVPWFS